MQQGAIVILFVMSIFIGLTSIVLPFLLGNSNHARLKQLQEKKESYRQDFMNSNQPKTKSIREKLAKKKWQKTLSEKYNLHKLFNLDKLRKKLVVAGYRDPNAVYTFVVAVFLVPVVLSVLAIDLSYGPVDFGGKSIKPLIVIGAFLFGIALPTIMIKNSITKRQEKLKQQFPEALDLIVVCVEAGLSLEQAFLRINQEIGEGMPEVSEEFALTGAELSYLGDRIQAFNNLETRTELADYKELAMTLSQSESYGTSISEALRTLSKVARNNKFMEIEKKAGALGPKMTVPMILFILPTMFMCLLGPAIIQVMKLK